MPHRRHPYVQETGMAVEMLQTRCNVQIDEQVTKRHCSLWQIYIRKQNQPRKGLGVENNAVQRSQTVLPSCTASDAKTIQLLRRDNTHGVNNSNQTCRDKLLEALTGKQNRHPYAQF